MEVPGIEIVQKVKKVAPKEGVQAACHIEDTLTISSEAQKRADWVEMLKQMPDIRPEKIEAALSTFITQSIIKETAEKMVGSSFIKS